ncbi:hypothetical protein [Halarchaeum salinum]
MALTAPTSVMEIAERADCATAEVRPHLEWLVERGLDSAHRAHRQHVAGV